MGSPVTATNRWDAVHDWAGLTVREYVLSHFYPPERITVLDVGAGWGKYREVLPEYILMDACEVWEPNVENEGLRDIYHNVFVEDVYKLVTSDDWPSRNAYDVAILGDVLEHLPPYAARKTVDRLLETCSEVLVIVPYLYEQHEEDGNPYEEHLQADLTPEVMASRYPMLELVDLEVRDFTPFKGLYRRRT